MSKQNTYALGIDMGGTKTLAAVVDITTGEIIGSARKRTRAEKGQDFVSQRTLEIVTAALEAANMQAEDLVAIGVGAAGQIDRQAGVVTDAPNLGVHDFPLGSILSDHFKRPVAVGNDVEVAALGEYLYGAGRGYKNFVCVFVGTGIGSGIVQNGRMYTGLTGTAGEVGHMVIHAGGRICGCGGRGCLEAYASRTAITKVIMAEIHHGRSSLLADDAQRQLRQGETIIRSGILANAIQLKDELTIEAVSEAADYLGIALGSLMNAYNPDCIILGGGVIEAIDLLFETAVHRARTTALAEPARKTPILRAKLGDFSGVVGASCLGAQAAGFQFQLGDDTGVARAKTSASQEHA
jgi:glucokinase